MMGDGLTKFQRAMLGYLWELAQHGEGSAARDALIVAREVEQMGRYIAALESSMTPERLAELKEELGNG